MWKAKTIALALVAWVVGVTVAHGQMGVLPGMPIGVRLEGYVGQGPAGVTPLVRWTIEVQEKNYKFTATKLDVLSGNTFYMNIITALDGYPVNLTFTGQQLDMIVNAGPDTNLTIIGTIQVGGGARYLFVSSVEAAVPTTPSAGQAP